MSDRGITWVGGKSPQVAMGEGPALPKQTSGGARKGSGKKPGKGGPELPKETSGKQRWSV